MAVADVVKLELLLLLLLFEPVSVTLEPGMPGEPVVAPIIPIIPPAVAPDTFITLLLVKRLDELLS